ncbi:MAG: roadblock/LC7 domain-containing protein [Anaerolineaceae bacterium]|nr:roadblock/LC7 domain-containing protein [Anaerolineaceae bacterium]
MAKLDELIREIQNELGADFRYMNIVGSDGLPIAGTTVADVNTEAVAARFTLIVKLASRVADKLHLGEVDDNLVTLDDAYILMELLGDESYFVILGLSKEAPLGVARMLLKEYADQLWDAIPR